MLRIRYLLYIGLFIYLLDLNKIGSDALSLLSTKDLEDSSEEADEELEDSSEVDESKERDEFYKKAYGEESRKTKSGERLQYPFNPYCSWFKLYGRAGLQANCFLDKIIGTYKVIRKAGLVIKAFF